MRIQNPTDIEAYLYTKGAKNKQYDTNLDGKIDVLSILAAEPDGYIEQTDYDANKKLYAGSTTRCGERLLLKNKVVAGLSFVLGRCGSPTGALYFRIRRVIDDSILAEATLLDVSTLATSLTWVDLELNTPVYINEEVRITVEYDGGDSSNYINVSYKYANVVSGGMRTYYSGGAWTDDGASDMAFKIHYYGNVIIPGGV